MPGLDDLPPLRAVISAHGLTAKKSLGQNFLFDLNLTRRIARAADVHGATVYEIGPGPGGLTRALLAEGAARVIAVERDERCIAALNELSAAFPDRLEIISADALTLDENQLLDGRGIKGRVRVAANLPYNIGTALLIKWLTSESWPPFWQDLTLMFQREVAERIVAAPGTQSYGRLSVLAQWRAQSKILFDVSRSAFVPPPKVTSSILRVEPLRQPVASAELGDLEAVTAAAFGQRRKMLRQSLKMLTPHADSILSEAGIVPTRRAETLSVAEFASLARAWKRLRVESGMLHVRE
jgi:16S rRNA (adenine1518-N6/adenine1519-N6)-dimethyltransferase